MTTIDQSEKSALASPTKDEGQDVRTSNRVLGSSVSRSSEVAYSVYTENQKRFIVFTASWAGFFSPVSSQIYFPALNTLARDLNVSNSLINLTLTSYMVRHQRRFADVNTIANIFTLDIPGSVAHVHR